MEVPEVTPFLRYWERVRSRTHMALDCIPPEQIEWRRRPGAFSFGDLIRHLAGTERFMFTENAHRRPSRYPGHSAALAMGYEDVLAYMTRLHEESVALLSQLRPADLQARCVTPGGASIPVWKWLRAMVEHECHHRGQIFQMLGDVGVTAPPLYGLTEEEVLAASED